jgi:transcriptional/translational regulatory protein YebC/TACO1
MAGRLTEYDTMDEALKTLLAQGLQVLKAGGEIGKAASSDNQPAATNPDLKAVLQAGSQITEQWAQRIERALVETGGADDVGNPVLEAHYKVSKQIRPKAPDDLVRDLGHIRR